MHDTNMIRFIFRRRASNTLIIRYEHNAGTEFERRNRQTLWSAYSR